MDFEYSDRSKALVEKLNKFMDEVIYPAEPVYEEQMEKAKDRWQLPPVLEVQRHPAIDEPQQAPPKPALPRNRRIRRDRHRPAREPDKLPRLPQHPVQPG